MRFQSHRLQYGSCFVSSQLTISYLATFYLTLADPASPCILPYPAILRHWENKKNRAPKPLNGMNAPSILESRAFVFGKMKNEGVPLVWATVVSAFFFAYLHSTNPGFGILPLLSIFIVGILYVLSYHYFGTIWFTCTAHMMWNFTQDFIFGLPDSGKPAAASVFSTTVTGSSFFYDEAFGIEGSWMAILVNLLASILIFLIGRKVRQRDG